MNYRRRKPLTPNQLELINHLASKGKVDSYIAKKVGAKNWQIVRITIKYWHNKMRDAGLVK